MGFERLRVYQAAELLDSLVAGLVKDIPRAYCSDADQLRRASGSVLYNIAEAFGNEQPGRKRNHIHIARGSIDETRAILRRLHRWGVFPDTPVARPVSLSHAIAKMLTAWLGTL